VPSPALTGRVRAAAASGALLSYPERRVAPPPGRLQRALMDDRETMSIFEPRVAADPLGAAEGFEVQDFNNTMTAVAPPPSLLLPLPVSLLYTHSLPP
jgi:hypothetical protein